MRSVPPIQELPPVPVAPNLVSLEEYSEDGDAVVGGIPALVDIPGVIHRMPPWRDHAELVEVPSSTVGPVISRVEHVNLLWVLQGGSFLHPHSGVLDVH